MKLTILYRVLVSVVPLLVMIAPVPAQVSGGGSSGDTELVQRRNRDSARHRLDSRNRFRYRHRLPFRSRHLNRPYSYNRFGYPYDYFHRYDRGMLYPYRAYPYYRYRYSPYYRNPYYFYDRRYW